MVTQSLLIIKLLTLKAEVERLKAFPLHCVTLHAFDTLHICVNKSRYIYQAIMYINHLQWRKQIQCKFKCKFCWLTHNAHTATMVIWNSMCKIYVHSSLSFFYLQHMSLGKITSRQGWVWRLHVEQSPKPLAISTFNQDDVRSVSLTVSRTTQHKQSQTLQLKLVKETWWPSM